MSIILFIQAITFVTHTLLGFFVLYKNPKAAANRYFWLFTIGLAGWNLSLFLAISEFAQPLFWGRLGFSFGTFMAPGLYLFSTVFPLRDERMVMKGLIVFLLGMALSVISLTDWIVKSAHIVDRTYITGELTPLFLVYNAYYFGVLIWSFARLIMKYRRATGIVRAQLQFVITGILIFFIPFFITQFILPMLGSFRFNNLGPLFSLPMAMLISYAIIRHQLMDIRIVIQRGLLYILTVGIVTALYFAFVFALEGWFRRTTDAMAPLSAIAAAIIVVFGFPYLKSWFQKITDPIFFKGEYNYLEVLHELSQVLGSTIELEKLMAEIEKILKKNLKVDKFLFAIVDGEVPMRIICKSNFDVHDEEVKNIISKTGLEILTDGVFNRFSLGAIIPLVSQRRMTAVLFLGKKLSSDQFSQKDLGLFNIFSNHAGIAFENARLYSEAKEHGIELENKVDERTKELRKLYDAQSQFLADISHELQTPLAVVKGNLDIFKKQSVSGKTDMHALDTAEKTIDKINSLVNDLLTLAKAEFGQGGLKKQLIELGEFLTEIYDDALVLAEK